MGQSEVPKLQGEQKVQAGPQQAPQQTINSSTHFNSSMAIGTPAIGQMDPRQVANHSPVNRSGGQRDDRFYL